MPLFVDSLAQIRVQNGVVRLHFSVADGEGRAGQGPQLAIPLAGFTQMLALLHQAGPALAKLGLPPTATAKSPPPVLRIDDFLDPPTCRLLMDAYEQEIPRVAQPSGDGYPQFDNRVVWLARMRESAAKTAMRQARARIIAALTGFFGVPTLYCDSLQLVKWQTGQSHDAHADNAFETGAPHATFWRSHTAVVYLNDDYTGGEFFFRDFGEPIKPRAGMLLGFGGGLDYMHGVKPVTAGLRYTLASWYSTDPARAENDAVLNAPS